MPMVASPTMPSSWSSTSLTPRHYANRQQPGGLARNGACDVKRAYHISVNRTSVAKYAQRLAGRCRRRPGVLSSLLRRGLPGLVGRGLVGVPAARTARGVERAVVLGRLVRGRLAGLVRCGLVRLEAR